MAHVVVIDVGKTLSKATLWTPEGELCARRTRPNDRVDGPGYRALDAEGIAAFIIESLSEFASAAPVAAIIPVGHGAAAALVRDDRLVCPPMDYEEPIPGEVRRIYDEQRDPVEKTGSPALPDGLNLGAQLHYLETLLPTALNSQILLWPQYWAWFLSGVAASEATSLGCHSDLWLPVEQGPSQLAQRRGWAGRLPPLRLAGDLLGTIRPELARQTGLAPDTKVHCGLHDSNAALHAARGFPEIAEDEATVLSTGTWFVAMRTPAHDAMFSPADLAYDRDCLINVDVRARLVPSARFMGGREIETLIGIDTRQIDIAPDQPHVLAAVPAVLEFGAVVLPTFAPGVGPFPHANGRWLNMPAEHTQRRAAVSLYAALVANASLDLIGAARGILVEGRFAEAQVFVRALASLRPDTQVFVANAHNDVSFGALRLINPELRQQSSLTKVAPLDVDLHDYADTWRQEADRLELAA